jgi:hypothetical protein
MQAETHVGFALIALTIAVGIALVPGLARLVSDAAKTRPVPVVAVEVRR